MPPRKETLRRLLSNRNLALLIGGNVISHTGDLIQVMAQSWLVLKMPNPGIKLGIIGFCQLLPRLLLSLVGGVLVDRLDRKRMMIWTQIAAMVQALLLTLLVWMDRVTFSHLVWLTLILGVANTLNRTARHSTIPFLVGKHDLQAAVSLDTMGTNLTVILGPTLGGLLLGFVGILGCMLVNGATFVLCVVALFAMRWGKAVHAPMRQAFGNELREGIRYVLGNDALWITIGISYSINTFGIAFFRLIPLFATDVLSVGEHGYGVLMSMLGIGSILGSGTTAVLGKTTRTFGRLYISTVILIGALLVFAWSRNFYLSCAALATVGLFHMVARTTAVATVHAATEDRFRGRVMSIFLLDNGLRSFGNLWVGWLSDLISPAFAVASSGFACLAVFLVMVGIAVRRRMRAEPVILEERSR